MACDPHRYLPILGMLKCTGCGEVATPTADQPERAARQERSVRGREIRVARAKRRSQRI